MEEDTQNDEEHEILKIQGLNLILKSINCEKYESHFKKYGIDEHTMLYLTENDLKCMNVDDKDIQTISTAINVLNKVLNLSEIQLSNDDILKMQSNICGQLGYIAIVINHIYYSMINDCNKFEDTLIDDYLSSVDASLMLKPYMRAEEKFLEKTIKNVFKIKDERRTILITTTVCTVFLFGLGIALRRSNYSLSSIFQYSN